MGQGELDLPIFQKFSFGLDQPSLFLNLRNGGSLHIGPLPPMPAHRELARAWGGELPRDAVALPVRINDRMVAVLYADGGLKADKSTRRHGRDRPPTCSASPPQPARPWSVVSFIGNAPRRSRERFCFVDTCRTHC